MSKGGSSSTEVDIPDWYQAHMQDQLARNRLAQQQGPDMWMGPSVAAASPLSQAAWQHAGAMGDAAGQSIGAGSAAGRYLPQPQSFAGGVQGYSAFPMVQENMQMVDQTYPGLMDALYQLYPALAPEGWEGEAYDWDAPLLDKLFGASSENDMDTYGGGTGVGGEGGSGSPSGDGDQGAGTYSGGGNSVSGVSAEGAHGHIDSTQGNVDEGGTGFDGGSNVS